MAYELSITLGMSECMSCEWEFSCYLRLSPIWASVWMIEGLRPTLEVRMNENVL